MNRRPELAALDWDHVRVFLAVSRAGQLASAATRLGMDVSTVSRRLDRLEAELGVHLFERTREGTVVTAAAESMLVAAEEMERGLARFATAVDAIETTAEGVVRLTVMPGVADAFVAPQLGRFRERFPRVRVELDASVGYADLTRREADLAVRAMRPKSGDLVVTRLLETRSIPMTSPAYAAELGRLRRWTDARWIAWGADLAHLPVAQWLTQHVPEGSAVLRTSHFQSHIAAAAAGVGVALLAEPYRSVARLVPVATTRALATSLQALPSDPLWLVGHRALRNVPRVAALWDFLVEVLSAEAARAAPHLSDPGPAAQRRRGRTGAGAGAGAALENATARPGARK